MRSFHLSDKFLKDAKETENKIEKTDSFVPFAHYEGKEQIIDPSLYDEEKGIYQENHIMHWYGRMRTAMTQHLSLIRCGIITVSQ